MAEELPSEIKRESPEYTFSMHDAGSDVIREWLFTYHNTRAHIFRPPYHHMNYVIHYESSDHPLQLFPKASVPMELMELGFPVNFRPWPTELEERRYNEHQRQTLAIELGELVMQQEERGDGGTKEE